MMRKFALFIVLCAPISLNAQTSPVVTVPASGVASTVIPISSSYQNGNVVRVTNGSTSTDCTTGGGTNAVLCYWTGSAWAPASGSGTGSVTSFSASALSPLFTTSTATPTTTPALSFSLNTQSANLIFAGPSSGAAAAPTFRALGLTDLPSTLAQFTGAITAGDCAKWSSAGVLADQGAACGSGGGFTAGGDLSGTSTSQTVIGLQGKSLAAPTTSNTFPEYNGTSIVWAAGTGTTSPGGASTQVQFNNAGVFGGIANWTWDGTNIALNGSGALNVTGLNNPAAPTLTVNGTAGTTTISYEVVVMEGSSTTAASPAAITTTASATLGGSNTITVTTATVTNSTSCKVYRTATNGTSPTTTGLIGTVSCGLAVTDNGLPGDGTTPSSVNNTGTITARNFVASGPGSAFTQWTTGSLSPGAAGTVLCGANAGNVFVCSDNGGPLANVAVAGNDLQVYSGNVMSVAGFMLTSPGNIGTQALTLQFNNDTTTGTVNDLLAKLGGAGPSPSAIKIATTDTDIPVYPVTSLTATSGAAILAVAGEAACTFDNATTYADYVVASTTTAADCHDAGASLPTGPVYVVGTVAQAGGAAGNYLVKGPGFFIAAVPASSPAIINGYCGGAVTASSFTYPFGMGGVNSTCAANDTVVNTGYVMPYAGTIVAMYVHAGISATTADVASVQINGSYATPAVQCTIAASGNACSVTGASAAFNAGDYIGVKIGTGASDTLGDISVSLEIQ